MTDNTNTATAAESNETESDGASPASPERGQDMNAAKTVVGALVDLGAAWAAHGLDAGRFSLENSARALTKTAKTLETLAREFEKKSRRNDAV
jgi:hypothetical protein